VTDSLPTGAIAYWYEPFNAVTGLVFNASLTNGGASSFTWTLPSLVVNQTETVDIFIGFSATAYNTGDQVCNTSVIAGAGEYNGNALSNGDSQADTTVDNSEQSCLEYACAVAQSCA